MASGDSLIGAMPTFAALMAGISIAVERVVEMIKAAVPVLTKKWQTHDEVRAGILQLIAAVSGAIMTSQMPEQIKSAIPGTLGNELHWPAYALLGLLSSAGSGAWNHVLDILGALKTKEESSESTAKATALATTVVGMNGAAAAAVPGSGPLMAAKTTFRVAEAAPEAKKIVLTTAAAAGVSGGTTVVREPLTVSAAAATSTAPAYSGRVISMGDRDVQLVAAVQHRLNQLGCGPIDEDGDFGAETGAAVELFQIRSADHFGLPLRVDGKVGPLTWWSLFAQPEVRVVQTASSPLLVAALKIAGGEVGVREDPLGSNRGPRVDQYLRAAGIDPATGSFPWCAAFVYWCFQQAALSLKIANPVIKTASVAEHWNKAGAAGIQRLSAADCNANPSLVAPGMIFVIMNSAGTGHTGLVQEIMGTYLATIEGNTNDNGAREGIGVFRRTGRTIADINRGFICY